MQQDEAHHTILMGDFKANRGKKEVLLKLLWPNCVWRKDEQKYYTSNFISTT